MKEEKHIYYKNLIEYLNHLNKKHDTNIGLEDILKYLNQGTGKDVTKNTVKNLKNYHLKREKKMDSWMIKQLFLGFNIPLEKFDFNLEDILTDFSPDFSPIKKVLYLHYDNDQIEDSSKLNDDINSIFEDFLSNAEKRIFVYDYLVYASNPKNNYYEKAHEKYFEKIEKLLKEKPNLKYTRILALPHYLWKKDAGKGSENFKMALEMCWFQTFAHLQRCLENFENQTDFFVTPQSRFYSYGIVDEQYIISEDYKHKEDFTIAPEMLIVAENDVNKKKSMIEASLRMHENDFDTLSHKSDGTKRFELLLEKQFMKFFAKQLYNDLQNKQNKLNSEIEKSFDKGEIDRVGELKSQLIKLSVRLNQLKHKVTLFN